MAKWATLLCCLLLVVSWSDRASSIKRLQHTWRTFEILQNLYSRIAYQDLLQNEGSSLTSGDVISKLKQLSQDIQASKDALLFKISDQLRSKLSENIDRLFGLVNDVEFVYKRYLLRLTNMRNYTVNDLWDFANATTLDRPNVFNGLERILFKMHDLLVNGDEKYQSTLAIINQESSHPSVICLQKESIQQLILDLYNLVVDTHTKGLLIRKFGYSLRKVYEEDYNYEQSIQSDYALFQEAVNTTYKRVKSAMEVAPRTLYKCNPSQWIQGENYVQLGPVLQTHIILSSDMVGDKGHCSSDNVKHTYFSDFSRNLEVSKRCESGHIRNCEPLGKSFDVCYSDKSSPRLYDWVKTANNHVFGYRNINNCANMTQSKDLGFFRSLFSNHCLCTCDSGRRAEDRYFSIRPFYSDYRNNKVVTGARLVKIERVFYIELEEGLLGPDGNIIGKPERVYFPPFITSNTWSTIEEHVASTSKKQIPYTAALKDEVQKFVFNTVFLNNTYVYPVTYDSRTVRLDELDAGENEVITGLKFDRDGDDLKLSIFVTPCDFKKGQLRPDDSYWKSSDFKGMRQEVVLTEPEVPSATNPKAEFEVFGNGRFVRFTPTDNRKDLGQNTVPFLDSQPISTNPPMPLTGAGLVLKRSGYSGGFLALQLKHYDLIDNSSDQNSFVF